MDLWSFAREEAARQGLDPELVLSVMRQESGGQTSAVSPKGARGPMQLMPGTARDLGVNIDDPQDNIRGGVRYLKQQFDAFGTPELALAAYNAGPGAVRKHGGVPPFAETQDYVRSIMGGGQRSAARVPSGADIFGFSDDDSLAGGDGGELRSGADIFGLEDEPAVQGASGAGGAGARLIEGEVLDDAQTQALNERALPYASRFRGRLTQEGLPRAQDEAYGRLADQGKLNFNADEGTEAFPAALTTTIEKADLKPGTWYIDLDGKVGQVPSLKEQHADDSWLRTGLNLGVWATNPIAFGALPLARDARADAIRNAGASGALMGGKNEIASAIEGVPNFVAGGLPAWQKALVEGINRRDAEDAKAKEAFPIAHDTAAGSMALLTGALMPELRGAGALATAGRAGVNTGLGAAGGFLSTDGGMEERTKGAAIGGGLGLALSPLLKIFGGITRAPGDLSTESGQAANAALEQLGTSTAELSPAGRVAMRKLVEEGRNPADAARVALAGDLPAPIPMTTGQITGLPGDQLDFNVALRGGAGAKASEEAQQFVNSQQAALDLNIARIVGGMADGPVPAWNEGGEAASQALNTVRDNAKRGVDAAYDAARAAEAPAILPKYDADALTGQMAQRVADFDPMRIGAVQRELDRIAMLSRGDVDLKRLFDARSRLTNLRISNDPIEARAASEAVKGFDDFVGDALSNELFHGDPDTVQLWRTAIGKRRDFGELFQAGDLVERLTEKTGYGGARRLKVDPGEAGNQIFGRSELGSIGRSNLYRDLGKIKSMVDADTWNQLRAEHFVRMAHRGEGAVEGGAQQFSGAKFLKAWNDAKAKDMRLVQSLYAPEEIDTINRFAAVAARVTNPVKGGDNPPNTAIAAMRAMGGLLGTFAKGTPLVRDIAKGIEEAMGRAAAKGAMKGEGRYATGTRSYQIPGRASAYVGSLIASEKPPQ